MRECRIILNVRADTTTCIGGVSECHDGHFGECFRTTDPELDDRSE